MVEALATTDLMEVVEEVLVSLELMILLGTFTMYVEMQNFFVSSSAPDFGIRALEGDGLCQHDQRCCSARFCTTMALCA